ncbi:hypothetical protein FRC04_010461 [Tulasnella sp. 424]|nr:hypothetical protein FRC04_010461 [Tulasnella sp. 424]KAG8978608.1 hypothetical protein FRC05_009880 [Tulasnella sp. 425]
MARSRPSSYTYSFKRVPWFVVRLMQPPESQGAVKSTLKRPPFRRVSPCRPIRAVIPPLKIQLRDVIEGKHLPPLSSTDFEDYLRFQEHSVENLYFIRWLDDYTAKYNAHAASPQAQSYNPQLALSFARARSTFLSAQSPLAINIESKNAIFPPDCKYPNPDALNGAKHEVEAMLRESLNIFITTRAQGNAGFFHLISVCTFGILCTLTGLVPILLQIYRGESAGVRSVRLASIPPFWIGMVAFLGAAHGVCPIVWMFGEGRQLRGYELARPQISAPVSHTTMMPKQLSATAPPLSNRHAREATGETAVGPASVDEDEADLKDHLSKMELGFPTPTSAVSELDEVKASPVSANDGTGKPIVVSIANAVTLDTRGTSPVFPAIPTPTSARPLMMADSTFNLSGSQTHIPLSPLGGAPPASATEEITSAPMAAVSSSPDPGNSNSKTMYPESTSNYTSTAFDHDEPYVLDLDSLSPGPQGASAALPRSRLPPRRPHCSRTLGSALREVAPPAPKWWIKIVGERDEDEFVGGSKKGQLPRPGPFAPMTPIESSIIRRSNYEVIARSLLIASILTGALAGGLYAVPMKAH